MSILISSWRVGELNVFIHTEKDGIHVEIENGEQTEKRVMPSWADADRWITKRTKRIIDETRRD